MGGRFFPLTAVFPSREGGGEWCHSMFYALHAIIGNLPQFILDQHIGKVSTGYRFDAVFGYQFGSSRIDDDPSAQFLKFSDGPQTLAPRLVKLRLTQ
jgi:hypothetical protein